MPSATIIVSRPTGPCVVEGVAGNGSEPPTWDVYDAESRLIGNLRRREDAILVSRLPDLIEVLERALDCMPPGPNEGPTKKAVATLLRDIASKQAEVVNP